MVKNETGVTCSRPGVERSQRRYQNVAQVNGFALRAPWSGGGRWSLIWRLYIYDTL